MRDVITVYREDRSKFFSDLLASLVVFLVALPLCMGIAIASGLPPALGLMTGIVGGLVVATISGSPMQVSGPAAGLTVIIWEFVHQHGLSMLGVVVLLAGLMQIAAGFLKLGQWFRAISPAVIYGMLSGIGLLIVASQAHVMVDDAPRGTGLANLLAIPQAIWKGLVPMDGTSHHIAAAIGLLTIAVIALWGFMPKPLKSVPAPLAGVLVGTLVAAIFQLPISYVELPDNLASVIAWPTAAAWQNAFSGPILIAAVTLAVVASAETMLSCTAVDRMHQGLPSDYNKELVAQGVGNTLCGAIGALPMTGVIVRSGANVQAGAATRMSAFLHGGWLLAFVAFVPFLLMRIPTTTLAALLVFTGFKLLSPKTIKLLAAYGRSEVAIYVITLGAIVATNLLEGILVGVGLSLLKLLYTFAHMEARLEPSQDGRHQVLHLRGAATFISLPRLAAVLDRVPAGTELHVRIEALHYIDHACLELLSNWQKRHEAAGGVLVLEWSTLNHKYHGKRPGVRSEGPAAPARIS